MQFDMPLKKRIRYIVDTSYYILCNKIINGDIIIYNEASMQLQLGTIMKQLGGLYEFSKNERFSIELEAPVQIQKETQKSRNGSARCDIKISLSSETETCEAFIELKYLKKSFTEAVTDNKFFVYSDIENLQEYKKINNEGLCYEIVYTDNINYTCKNDYKFCIGDGYILSAGSYEYTKDRKIIIEKEYNFHWDIYKHDEQGTHCCFLKLEL